MTRKATCQEQDEAGDASVDLSGSEAKRRGHHRDVHRQLGCDRQHPGAVGARHVPALMTTQALQASLELLCRTRDDALAVLTVPPTVDNRYRLAPDVPLPAVDLALWTDHVRYARRRDRSALEALVEHYGPHAEAIARNLYRHGEPLQDLTQTAFEALLVALQRFDPERSRPFLAYAKPTITGVIRRHYRDLGWSLRIPRRVHELAGPIREAHEMLAQDLGRQPSNAEIADFLDIDEDELREVLLAQEARNPTPLDKPNLVSGQSTVQLVGQTDPGFVWTDNHTALKQAMVLLPESDQRLLHRYFYDELTQEEIAEEYGCSQMQISRLLGNAIRRLRRRIVGD